MLTDLLEDLSTYFTASGMNTVCYRDTMLDDQDDAVALYEYNGQTFAPQVSGANRSVQVVCRSKSPTTAKEQARLLYHALEVEDGILNLTASRWTMVDLASPPFKLKIDEKDRVYYCFNIKFITYPD